MMLDVICEFSELKKRSKLQAIRPCIFSISSGCQIVRRKGSHVVLRKVSTEGTVVTVVPNHPEIKIGTLKSVLELAKVREEDFSQYQ